MNTSGEINVASESAGSVVGPSRHPLLVLFWGIAVFASFVVIQYPSIFVGALVGGIGFKDALTGSAEGPLFLLGKGVASIVIGLPWVILMTKLLWRRPLAWLRLECNLPLFLLGALLGLILPPLILLLSSPFASISITAAPDPLSVANALAIGFGSLGFYFFIGLSEEIFFRGILAREWAYRWNWIAATIAGGLVFGLLHLPAVFEEPNPLLVLPWVLLAAFIGNLLFMALYLRSGSLALPIGFHTTWNMTLSALLGVTLSGHEPGQSLLRVTLDGPALITGGPFGIEAGIMTMLSYCVISALLLLGQRRFGRNLLPAKPDA